ncbi:hypothetical protein C7M84_021580 [Penaeus vannamei]|uniref:Uncharacterized protein n=1 Tax=Penaeus vannamei TaxID=6689 RepID=A0A3R7NKJ8_PENVA|nr:hypothetical protein C7M84_021580 [Penaeus vannamei]
MLDSYPNRQGAHLERLPPMPPRSEHISTPPIAKEHISTPPIAKEHISTDRPSPKEHQSRTSAHSQGATSRTPPDRQGSTISNFTPIGARSTSSTPPASPRSSNSALLRILPRSTCSTPHAIPRSTSDSSPIVQGAHPRLLPIAKEQQHISRTRPPIAKEAGTSRPSGPYRAKGAHNTRTPRISAPRSTSFDSAPYRHSQPHLRPPRSNRPTEHIDLDLPSHHCQGARISLFPSATGAHLDSGSGPPGASRPRPAFALPAASPKEQHLDCRPSQRKQHLDSSRIAKEHISIAPPQSPRSKAHLELRSQSARGHISNFAPIANQEAPSRLRLHRQEHISDSHAPSPKEHILFEHRSTALRQVHTSRPPAASHKEQHLRLAPIAKEPSSSTPPIAKATHHSSTPPPTPAKKSHARLPPSAKLTHMLDSLTILALGSSISTPLLSGQGSTSRLRPCA